MQHTEDCWADWGGKKDKNETAWQTARREFTEETRGYFQGKIDLSQPTSAPLTYSYVRHSKDGKQRITHHMFLMRIAYVNPQHIKNCSKINDTEKKDCRWFEAGKFIEIVDKNTTYKDKALEGKNPVRFNFFNLCKKAENLPRLQLLVQLPTDVHWAPIILSVDEPTGEAPKSSTRIYPSWKFIAIPVALAGLYGIYRWWFSAEESDDETDNTEQAKVPGV